MEEWAAASKEANAALAKEKSLEKGRGKRKRKVAAGVGEVEMATSMDDGGGSEGLWGPSGEDPLGLEGRDLFEDVPVGIREFMKQEKRLKEKHARDGTSGG